MLKGVNQDPLAFIDDETRLEPGVIEGGRGYSTPPDRIGNDGRNQFGGDARSRMSGPQRAVQRKLNRLPGPKNKFTQHLTLVQYSEDLPKREPDGYGGWVQCRVKPWIPPVLSLPFTGKKSNWRFTQVDRNPKFASTRYEFRIPYIDNLGYETNAIYASWTCTPEEWVVSRARTVFYRWCEFFNTHQIRHWGGSWIPLDKPRNPLARAGANRGWIPSTSPVVDKLCRSSKAALLVLASFDSVYYRACSYLQDRVHGLLRFSTKLVAKRLWGLVHSFELKHRRPPAQHGHEVFRTRVLDTLTFLHPTYSRRYGDKTIRKRKRPPPLSRERKEVRREVENPLSTVLKEYGGLRVPSFHAEKTPTRKGYKGYSKWRQTKIARPAGLPAGLRENGAKRVPH